MASECANDQGRFWTYHDTLFLNQRGENLGAFNRDALKNFAAALGLDQDAFNDCLDSNRHRSTVQAETNAGSDRGITSTPTIVVNGEVYPGVVPFNQLQDIIEAELGR